MTQAGNGTGPKPKSDDLGSRDDEAHVPGMERVTPEQVAERDPKSSDLGLGPVPLPA
jgi:hypothetical protein